MARKKKAKLRKIAGFKLPKPVVKALRRFLETPFGREVAAAALAAAAQTLITRHPMAAAASAGSGVAGAAKTVAGHAAEQVASLLHGASDRLRQGLSGSDPHDDDEDDDDRARASRAAMSDAGGEGMRAGRRNGRARDMRLDESLFGDLSAKEIRKLVKAARRDH